MKLNASALLERNTLLRGGALGQYWRVFAAGFSGLLFCIGALLPGIVAFTCTILPLPSDVRQSRVRRSVQLLCRFYIRVLRLLGLFRLTVEGSPPQQISGHVVVVNHSMLIDALFLLAYVDNVCCVVKGSLADHWLTRMTVKSAGYIANDDPQLLDKALAKLRNGENILIFPEGTRTAAGEQLEFKRGAANLAVLGEAPILPVLLCCDQRLLGKSDKWYQMPESQPLIALRFFSPLTVADCIDTSRVRTLQYRSLTQYMKDFYRVALRLALAPDQANEA